MIGHYLLTLTPPEEYRVLTRQFWPHDPDSSIGHRCLVQCAELIASSWKAEDLYDWEPTRIKAFRGERLIDTNPADRYDNLCWRFGTERVNAAIRNRILTNIARRELAKAREAVPA